MLRICTSLGKAGYDVWLVGRRLPNSKPFDNQHFKHHQFSTKLNKGKLFYIEYNVRLFFWLLAQQFDIVCGIDLDSILPCYFSAKIKHLLRGSVIKVVYDAHELFSETPEVVRRPFIQKIWLAIERFIVPKVDAVYTVSQSVADEFERRYGRRFELIRNFPMREIELKNQNPTSNMPSNTPSNSVLNQNKTYPLNVELLDNQLFANSHITKKPLPAIILYQGALNEGRGLDTAIDAMQYVDNAELWLIGEGDLSQILRGSVERLALQKKVKFLGFIVPEVLPFYTAKATVGLHISEDKGLSYRYSLANKFLDYVQSEVPQICTQFPEYQRLNKQYKVAVLIEKTDTLLLVAALNRLLNDTVFYQQIKENCRQAAAVLCWEKEEKHLIQLYEKL